MLTKLITRLVVNCRVYEGKSPPSRAELDKWMALFGSQIAQMLLKAGGVPRISPFFPLTHSSYITHGPTQELVLQAFWRCEGSYLSTIPQWHTMRADIVATLWHLGSYPDKVIIAALSSHSGLPNKTDFCAIIRLRSEISDRTLKTMQAAILSRSGTLRRRLFVENTKLQPRYSFTWRNFKKFTNASDTLGARQEHSWLATQTAESFAKLNALGFLHLAGMAFLNFVQKLIGWMMGSAPAIIGST